MARGENDYCSDNGARNRAPSHFIQSGNVLPAFRPERPFAL